MSDQIINVNAGGKQSNAGITPNRPRWIDMEMNYPDEYISTAQLYPAISETLVKNYNSNPVSWENSCAIRMSKALNYSGVKLSSSDITYRDPGMDNGVTKGNDGYFYWHRVKPLGKYLAKFLGNPEVSISLKRAKYGEVKEKMSDEDWEKVKTTKGIIMFDVSGWGNASGHFTLWDGSNLLYAPGHHDYLSDSYYFHLKYDVLQKNGKKIVVQTDKIRI